MPEGAPTAALTQSRVPRQRPHLLPDFWPQLLKYLRDDPIEPRSVGLVGVGRGKNSHPLQLLLAPGTYSAGFSLIASTNRPLTPS